MCCRYSLACLDRLTAVSQRTTSQTSHWRKASLRVPHLAYPQHGTSVNPDRQLLQSFPRPAQKHASRVQAGASDTHSVQNPVAPERKAKRKTTTTHIHHVFSSRPQPIKRASDSDRFSFAKSSKATSARFPEQRMCPDVRMHSRTLVTPCETSGSVSRRSGVSRRRGGYLVVLVVLASVGGSCEAESHFGGLANNQTNGESKREREFPLPTIVRYARSADAVI